MWAHCTVQNELLVFCFFFLTGRILGLSWSYWTIPALTTCWRWGAVKGADHTQIIPNLIPMAHLIQITITHRDFFAKWRTKVQIITGESNSKQYLIQRISVTMQRGNVAAVLGSVGQSHGAKWFCLCNLFIYFSCMFCFISFPGNTLFC